ncbi:serine/arginine repetitive matrix protein 1-like isoform X2 [Papaver somniferum]|uniref:serine/arginine repetitive matrix protein 1-like isoform X2 n=1 Tax=Papaver somniferum TaxID=3469 RepID=UPI000E7019AB|nr:serine/arginine repetitive matrix protein 1-like isoform X2 [Papaver somniferum]
MSGGFFRGTSADQDTRFSNKQAKLLKSQKFAPELDHLVDIRKVKMDVVKPWIATRVTEFLGFEDEVLINFIYGLLDGKEINGKEVQIQLTGFMEKNTGKFMKELWNLLRSAEQNASGVPQQFLDAKEEEIKKKKEEADRITLEIQKKRDIEQEKAKEMDGEVDKTRSQSDGFHSLPKRLPPVGEEDIASEERNGSRGNNRLSRSPHSAQRGLSPKLKLSRSISRSPPRRRSISPDRRYRSPIKRSISPRRRPSPRRHRSPLRRRSPYSRRRSTSRSWRRSPSPARRRSRSPARRRSRSPGRRRSPSPARRRSPSPVRRRSPIPVRRRSPSPVRRRSPPPMRRRSPSPRRRRSPSPFQRRSRRRSPTPRRRSPSPFRRRSPSPLGSISPPRRSPSPISPKVSRRSPMGSPQQRNRSRSPYRSRSPVYRSRRSLSRDREIQTNGMGSKTNRDDYPSQRIRGRRSPVRHTPEREEVKLSDQEHRALDPVSRRPQVSLRSPQREPRKQSGVQRKVPVRVHSPEKSPSGSESPPPNRKVISGDDKRTFSPSESPLRVTRELRNRAESASPVRQIRDHGARHRGSPETSGDEDASHARRNARLSPRKRTRLSPAAASKNMHDEEYSPEDSARDQPGDARSRHADNVESRKKDRDFKSEKASVMAERPGRNTQNISSHSSDVVDYGHGRVEGEKSKLDVIPDEQTGSKKRSRSSNLEGNEQGDKLEALQKPTKRVDHQIATSDSDSEENEKYRIGGVDKRKEKESERHQMASGDDASDDSQIDTKKDAKRRRKEEKRLRKEEKRRRREERHRKKEERRAGRLKSKSKDTVPSDTKKNQKFGDDDVALRRESHLSDTEEDIDPKQHEIELRKRALESLRAKKAINP